MSNPPDASLLGMAAATIPFVLAVAYQLRRWAKKHDAWMP